MHIAHCYTYPVKGMTARHTDTVQLQPGRSVTGDRAFVFAFGNAEQIGQIGWVSKRHAVTLLNTPHLSQIEAAWNEHSRILTITANGDSEAALIDHEDSRQHLADWFAQIVHSLPENPLTGRPEREPLRLLGDGTTRFTDRGPTQISLASNASLHDLSQHAGAHVDFRRFRLNFAIDNLNPWQELDWIGKRIHIGQHVQAQVTAPIQRCNAINASPDGDGRDAELMQTLQHAYGHLNFGIEANVLTAGPVHVGDTIRLADA